MEETKIHALAQYQARNNSPPYPRIVQSQHTLANLAPKIERKALHSSSKRQRSDHRITGAPTREGDLLW